MTDGASARGWRAAFAVTAAALAIRLLLAARLPLFPDETYYWEWSRRLATGYFDHPPLIAWLIAAGTGTAALFGAGPSPLAIRFFPALAGGLASLAAAAIAGRLAGGRAAFIAAVAFALMPLAATGLVLATPDAPLLAASAVGLYFVTRALQASANSAASLGAWTAAGIALGFAFSSKYTSILLPLGVTAAVLLRPSLRARLREPGPYVACLAAVLVFLPVLLWNARNEWASFVFQLNHGLGTPAKGSAIKRELDLVGGQLGLVSPILFVMAAVAVGRSLRRTADDVRFTLAVTAAVSWMFFVYSATRRSVEANWPAPSYIPGIALLAALVVTGASAAHDRWLRRGIGLAAVLVAIIYVHALYPVLPLPARRDPVARSAGWDGLAARVEQVRRTLPAGTVVATDRYQETSELAYHLPGRPVVYCTCVSGRRNQYEWWAPLAGALQPGGALLLAIDDTPGEHPTVTRLAPHFTRAVRGDPVPVLRGADTVFMRRTWVMDGYRGGWPMREAR